jgi:hypothetical protein
LLWVDIQRRRMRSRWLWKDASALRTGSVSGSKARALRQEGSGA